MNWPEGLVSHFFMCECAGVRMCVLYIFVNLDPAFFDEENKKNLNPDLSLFPPPDLPVPLPTPFVSLCYL